MQFWNSGAVSKRQRGAFKELSHVQTPIFTAGKAYFPIKYRQRFVNVASSLLLHISSRIHSKAGVYTTRSIREFLLLLDSLCATKVLCRKQSFPFDQLVPAKAHERQARFVQSRFAIPNQTSCNMVLPGKCSPRWIQTELLRKFI